MRLVKTSLWPLPNSTLRYVSGMAYDASINVRLSPEIKTRLETLALEFGVKSSDLIRQAVEDYVRKLEGAEVIEFRRKPREESAARLPAARLNERKKK
jgi:Ribbon-helix-helix domain